MDRETQRPGGRAEVVRPAPWRAGDDGLTIPPKPYRGGRRQPPPDLLARLARPVTMERRP
jgi:hypothetical protein